MEATGAALRRPYYLSLLAQACARAGRIDEALDMVSEAASIVDTTGEHWRDADLQRMRGELFMAKAAVAGAPEAAGEWLGQAELAFRRAVETGMRQGALALAGQAAKSLATLLGNAGRPEDAEEVREDLRRSTEAHRARV